MVPFEANLPISCDIYLYFPIVVSRRGTKIGTCLLSNICLGFGVSVVSRLEIRQEGLLWTNVGEPLSLDDPFRVGYVYMMLIVDALLYMVIAW